MNKPLLGVTCYIEDKLACEKNFNTSPLYISYPEYDLGIAKAGGIPVNIPIISQHSAREFAEKLDGLLICGGEDVTPELYNEKDEGQSRHILHRDQFELSLLEAFIEKRKPILGICRGLQLINVYFGGTLIQDISAASDKYLKHTRSDSCSKAVHNVKLSGSWAKTLGTVCGVNSMHHQAVKKLGQGLKVVGLSEDGLIEAFEYPGYPFLFAVQWHPEMLLPMQEKIFQAFVDAADISIKKAI